MTDKVIPGLEEKGDNPVDSVSFIYDSETSDAVKIFAALRDKGTNYEVSSLKTFVGLISRDLRVLTKNIGEVISRTAMQPFLFVFVFAYLFPKIGQGFSGTSLKTISFATILVPGLVGVAATMSGVMAVGLPLAIDLGVTKEIEDRAMAPVPVWMVGAEKIIFGAIQGLISALIVFPLVILVPSTPVQVHVSNWLILIVVIFLACMISGSLGLTLGSLVRPEKIGLMFSLLVLPLTMLGCIYYPWASLSSVRWLQILVLLNPMVYVSEGLRQALTPQLPHMPTWGFLTALFAIAIFLTLFGLKLFVRRVQT